ncbi:hypothetical protein COY95_04230 [Candidatus Woesearchaeota archaeon CG_4_10_14_0_8_um_filter_47_5]|nr:MAG: hypothetical protein COY95_04230 [Candidatus Woesearchaeota archaeon CG_4_10_14_0_8_um_filter_47_5]
MPAPLIRVHNLTVGYSEETVLEQVSFDVHQHEILGFVGLSGSGKTTLLKTLIGDVLPFEGEIQIITNHAEEKLQDNLKSFRKHVGFSAQSPSFYPELTVGENLDFFAAMYGLTSLQQQQNTQVVLSLVGLESSRSVLAKNLSGGMQKRLDIACSLIHGPKILLLDEPTADLDPVLRRQILDVLKRINKRGTTLILVSHFLDEIVPICSRIGFLHNKNLLFMGTFYELKNTCAQEEEIHLETAPGRYDAILDRLTSKKNIVITHSLNKGHMLVLYTPTSNAVLHELLHVLEALHEDLLDISLTKPTLTQIFEEMVKK